MKCLVPGVLFRVARLQAFQTFYRLHIGSYGATMRHNSHFSILVKRTDLTNRRFVALRVSRALRTQNAARIYLPGHLSDVSPVQFGIIAGDFFCSDQPALNALLAHE
jgi:hypothetical protein